MGVGYSMRLDAGWDRKNSPLVFLLDITLN